MAAPVISSLTVNANGCQLDVVLDQAVTGMGASDFVARVAGRNKTFKSVTGSGASYSLIFTSSFVGVSDTVTLSYTGTSVINGSSQPMATFSAAAVTNSSAILNRIKDYCDARIKTFFHFSGRTFFGPSTPNQSQVNAFDCTNYSMDQWLDVAQSMRATYVVLTTKHDFGFSIWPTAQGNFNIGTTAWNIRTPGIDVVGDFTTKAKARGLKVGFYYNMYDPWWINVRSGSDGTYSQNLGQSTDFTHYVNAHITELAAYVPDFFWFDSWEYRSEIGYTNANYADITAHIASVLPNGFFLNNAGAGAQNSLAHTQICIAERQGGSGLPATSTSIPYEYTETCGADGNWTIPPADASNLISPTEPPPKLIDLYNNRRSSYLYNLMPDSTGRIPAGIVTHAQALGNLVTPYELTRTLGTGRR